VTVKGCTITLAVILLSAVIVLAIAIVGFQLSLNAEAERKIMTVLTDHYPKQQVSVQYRSDLSRRWDYQFYYQACFDLLLEGKERRVAMVQGDDDGGSFSFGGEYPSMQACEAHFFRG
jgi:hypothetical protein